MKKFFLDDPYRKVRRRLVLVISVIVGPIYIVVENLIPEHPLPAHITPSLPDSPYDEWTLKFLSGVALTWVVYGTILWILKALPDKKEEE